MEDLRPDLLTRLMDARPLENRSVATPYTCIEWGVPIILSNGGSVCPYPREGPPNDNGMPSLITGLAFALQVSTVQSCATHQLRTTPTRFLISHSRDCINNFSTLILDNHIENCHGNHSKYNFSICLLFLSHNYLLKIDRRK